MNISEYIGERLMLARRRQGLRQSDVADALGFTQATLSKWENGTRAGPGWAILYRLANLYGVPLGFFIEGVEEILNEDTSFSSASARVLALAA